MKIFKNIFWLLLERSAQVIGSFVISGLIARQLGVTAYGDFQYALSVILIFSAVGLICGAEVLLPKVVLVDKENINSLMTSGFVLRFLASAVAYLCIVLYGLFFVESSSVFLLVCILGFTVFLREPFSVVVLLFQSKTHSKPIALTSIGILTLKIAALALLCYFNAVNVWRLSMVWVVEVVLLAFIYSALYFRELKQYGFIFRWELGKIKALFDEGLVYWFPLVLMAFFWRVDRLLVKNYASAHDAGVYLAAMQIFDAVLSVALMMAVSAAPILVYRHTEQAKIKANTLKLASIMSLIGITGAITGYFVAPYLVPKLFGVAFMEAASITQTALWLSVLVFVEAALNVYLIKNLGGKYALMKWLGAVLIATPVEYFAIKAWGAQAAHIGIAFGYIYALIYGFYWLKRNLKNEAFK
jgi:polysaccharide transporter, PST family